MAAKQNIRKEGNLEKKSRWLGMWRKRWTVLQTKNENKDNGYVSTYKKEKVYKSPTESIRIDNNTDIEAFIDKKDQNEVIFFIQNKSDKERFLFKAQSKKDRDEWIECITKNVHRASIEEVVNGLNNYHSNDENTNGNEEQKYCDKNEEQTVDNKPENDANNALENMDKNIEEKQNNSQVSTNNKSENEIVNEDDDLKKIDIEQHASITEENAPKTDDEIDNKNEKDAKSELEDDQNIAANNIVDKVNNDDVSNQEVVKPVTDVEKDVEPIVEEQESMPQKPESQPNEEILSAEESKVDDENVKDIESELENTTIENDEDTKLDVQSEANQDENRNENEIEEQAAVDTEETKIESNLAKNIKSEDNISGNSESEEDDAVGVINETQTFEPKQMEAHTPETPLSMASSLRSDGDPVFGDRWGGFDLNATDEENEQNENEQIDTSQMEYANIVLIGSSKSGKSMLVNNIMQNEQNEEYEETMKNVTKFQIFLDEDGVNGDDDDEKLSKNGVCCSLIDTNGNMQNMKDVIIGIGQSDICILCVSVNDENFDCFKDYLRVLNTFGIERFIVCLSYMDKIDFNQQKYEKCQAKIEKIMKKIGIKAKKCAFIPISNVNGDNITKSTTNDSFSWYKGWTFKKSNGMTVCDAIKTMISQFGNKKAVDQHCILPISEIVSDGVYRGKIEQGMIKPSDTMKSALNGDDFVIDSICRGPQSMQCAKHGDFVSISVSAKNDNLALSVGDVMYVNGDDDALSIKPCKSIKALVAVSSSEKINVGKFEGMICIRSSMIQCELTKIYWTTNGKNDKKIKNASYLMDKAQAEIELVFKEPFIGTSFKQCECLGRFVVINENKPVLVGKIQSTQ